MEDTVNFSEVDTPIDNMTPTIDDTLQRYFYADYLTKYQRPLPGEEDSYLHDTELEEASRNVRRHGEPADDFIFTDINARYDQMDGLLWKEYSE